MPRSPGYNESGLPGRDERTGGPCARGRPIEATPRASRIRRAVVCDKNGAARQGALKDEGAGT